MKPSYLKKGDMVGIVAPARRVEEDVIFHSKQLLESWGLKVELGKHLFSQYNQFAGTDVERQTDLQYMLDNPAIKAVFCARGGYGTIRIIDGIDFSSFLKSPKWIVGYSDITVLHSHIFSNFGVETLHATMPINFFKNDRAAETMKNVLFGEKVYYEFDSSPINRVGKVSGEVIGGNLSILYALAGSSSDFNTEGKILFIEDLDEYLYHVDRMMINLKRAGKLKNIVGLMVGGLTNMKDNETPFGKTAEQIILDTVKEYAYPVCFNFPAGHTDENMPIIIGRNSNLTITSSKVSFEQLN